VKHCLARRLPVAALIACFAGAASLPSVKARVALAQERQSTAPIALHPTNPHYFLWRERPTILLTSGEHYGAVLNLDFDFRRYLDTLAADGLNYTRVFSGAYVEPQGAFQIAENTLAPRQGRFIAPWARSEKPGYPNGGNRFDLTRWDEAYFARLKDFVGYAAARNVVVEVSLFCPMYEEVQWALSPMNDTNNVNGLGVVRRTDVHTLDANGGLLAVQIALTRKIVTELNGFDNVFFEIANEPYFGGVTVEWQHRIADSIVETERGLPFKHLISQNIANKSAKVETPHPAVSIFNFHYATPPETVAINYALDRVIGDDETGFRGTADVFYRSEAWEFVLAGGGVYNNLDYSFTAGHEDGSFVYPTTQPGGGSRALRRQLAILRDFVYGFDFLRMTPDPSIVKAGVPAGGAVRALVSSTGAIALYLRKALPPATPSTEPSSLQIELADGQWQIECVNPLSGTVVGSFQVDGSGVRMIEVPAYELDIAVRLNRIVPK